MPRFGDLQFLDGLGWCEPSGTHHLSECKGFGRVFTTGTGTGRCRLREHLTIEGGVVSSGRFLTIPNAEIGGEFFGIRSAGTASRSRKTFGF